MCLCWWAIWVPEDTCLRGIFLHTHYLIFSLNIIKWCLLIWSLILILFSNWHVSLLVESLCSFFCLLRLASVDLPFKQHIQNCLLSILNTMLTVGSSASSNLVLAYWDFEQKNCILFKHFDKYLYIFSLSLILGMCLCWWAIWVPEDTCLRGIFLHTHYLIFSLNIIKWCLLIWSLILILFSNWHVSLLVESLCSFFCLLRLASVDLPFKQHIQNCLLSILNTMLTVGSSASSNLVLAYWDFEQKNCILFKHFDKYLYIFMM